MELTPEQIRLAPKTNYFKNYTHNELICTQIMIEAIRTGEYMDLSYIDSKLKRDRSKDRELDAQGLYPEGSAYDIYDKMSKEVDARLITSE